MGEGQARGELGSEVVGSPVSDDAVMTNDGAGLHRDLAIGNFFVALRGLVVTADKFLQMAMEEEQTRGTRR